jgi:hypothetical protein
VLAVLQHLDKVLLGVHHKQVVSLTLAAVGAVLLLLVLQRLEVTTQPVRAVLERLRQLQEHL